MKAANEPGFEPALSSNTRALAATPALYLVGTPIGNLEDITLRALRVLKEVDLIACEDTRHTQKLLNHFGIITRLTSYHEHNESAKSEELVRQIEAGTRIALVTDAGMPGISDPGFRLVSLAIEHDIAIVPSRRTRDPEDVDISWEIDAYPFELPLIAAAMDEEIEAAKNIDWRYYAPGPGQSGYVWSIFNAFPQVRNDAARWAKVVPYTQFLTDLTSNGLQSISWIDLMRSRITCNHSE